MGYRLLTILLLALHFGYLGYLVAGGFLAWRWPRTIWTHALAAAWAATTVTFHLVCPLTWAEDQTRQRAGEPPLTEGFINRYIEGTLYPQRYALLVQVLVAVLVVGSWLGLAWRQQRRSRKSLVDGTRATKAGNPRTPPLP